MMRLGNLDARHGLGLEVKNMQGLGSQGSVLHTFEGGRFKGLLRAPLHLEP